MIMIIRLLVRMLKQRVHGCVELTWANKGASGIFANVGYANNTNAVYPQQEWIVALLS